MSLPISFITGELSWVEFTFSIRVLRLNVKALLFLSSFWGFCFSTLPHIFILKLSRVHIVC